MTVQLEQELAEHRKENSGTWLLRYDLGHGKPIFHAKSVKKKRCWTVPLWVLFGRRNIAPNRNDNPFFPSSTEGYRFFLTCLKFTDCWKSFIFSGKISKGHTVFFHWVSRQPWKKACMFETDQSSFILRHLKPVVYHIMGEKVISELNTKSI